jgi:drug/metabolite transporter (DMT)-like permease
MLFRKDWKTPAAVAVTLLLWASAFAGIKAGLAAYSPGELALLRFLCGSASMALFARSRGFGLPARQDLPHILLVGFLGFTVYHVFLNYGEQRVSAGAASLIVSLGEGGGIALNPGCILVLISSLGSSLYNVFQKPFLKRYDPIAFTAYAMTAGTVFMLVFAPGLPAAIRGVPMEATLSVIYLGVFPGAIAYSTWTYALSRMPASRLTTSLYISPVLAIAIAWLWIGEVPTVLSILGGVVTLAGVLLTNTWGK